MIAGRMEVGSRDPGDPIHKLVGRRTLVDESELSAERRQFAQPPVGSRRWAAARKRIDNLRAKIARWQLATFDIRLEPSALGLYVPGKWSFAPEVIGAFEGESGAKEPREGEREPRAQHVRPGPPSWVTYWTLSAAMLALGIVIGRGSVLWPAQRGPYGNALPGLEVEGADEAPVSGPASSAVKLRVKRDLDPNE